MSDPKTPKKKKESTILPQIEELLSHFDPTADTDAGSGNTPALAQRGSWGSIFRVDLNPDRNTGKISIFVLGDAGWGILSIPISNFR